MQERFAAEHRSVKTPRIDLSRAVMTRPRCSLDDQGIGYVDQTLKSLHAWADRDRIGSPARGFDVRRTARETAALRMLIRGPETDRAESASLALEDEKPSTYEDATATQDHELSGNDPSPLELAVDFTSLNSRKTYESDLHLCLDFRTAVSETS